MRDAMLYATAFLSALLLTAVLRQYALRKGLLDIPNDRSSHSTPTPRGGGLSIVLCFMGSLAWMYWQNRVDMDVFSALLGGGLLVAFIGFWDDHRPISAHWRILVHLLAALWVVYFIGGLAPINGIDFQIRLGGFVSLLGILFLVFWLNLYNFMDGIDGIAAVEGIFISLSASILMLAGEGSNDYSTLLFILAMACLGFLVWNWPPAKIFMGDVGSGFLGLILGTLALSSSLEQKLSFWSWTVLFGVFLVDGTVTLVRRFLQGDRWYEAHRSHAYQIASRLLGSHKTVTLTVATVNVFWLLPFAALATVYPSHGMLCVLVSYVPLVYSVLILGAGKP